MNEKSSVERFYRLVYFLPRPEDEERVCVGILISDSGRVILECDNRFEKARCFAPDYSVESLKFVLETLREKADAGGLRRETSLSSSPQFQLSAPRVLLQPVNEQVRQILRRRFLLRTRLDRASDKEKGVGRRIDHLLGKINVSASYLKRLPSFSMLFGADASSALPNDLVPRPVRRAVAFDNQVVLLDGVNLHARSTDALVDTVGRVSHLFWQYDVARDFSRALSNTKLTRAALLFNGDGHAIPDALKWRRDYARHELQKDAELVVEPGEATSEDKLRSVLRPLLSEI